MRSYAHPSAGLGDERARSPSRHSGERRLHSLFVTGVHNAPAFRSLLRSLPFRPLCIPARGQRRGPAARARRDRRDERGAERFERERPAPREPRTRAQRSRWRDSSCCATRSGSRPHWTATSTPRNRDVRVPHRRRESAQTLITRSLQSISDIGARADRRSPGPREQRPPAAPEHRDRSHHARVVAECAEQPQPDRHPLEPRSLRSRPGTGPDLSRRRGGPDADPDGPHVLLRSHQLRRLERLPSSGSNAAGPSSGASIPTRVSTRS